MKLPLASAEHRTLPDICRREETGATLTADELTRVTGELQTLTDDRSDVIGPEFIYFCMLCTPSSMRYEDEMDEHMRERHQIGPEWREKVAR